MGSRGSSYRAINSNPFWSPTKRQRKLVKTPLGRLLLGEELVEKIRDYEKRSTLTVEMLQEAYERLKGNG